MKKIISIVSSLAIAASVFIMPFSAGAVTPIWDVTGNWVIDFEWGGGHYLHDAFLTQTGVTITGNGGHPAGGLFAYAWTITSGSIDGSNNVSLTMDYTLGASCTMDMTGVIAPDGTMSGTWHDNCGGDRTSTWTTNSGAATKESVPPVLNDVGFTANGDPIPKIGDNYVLVTDCSAATTYDVQYSDATTASEELATGPFPLKLTYHSSDLTTYYNTKPEPWKTYLNNAALGLEPFAYIYQDGSDIKLADGAVYNILAGTKVDMRIPGDYPPGLYTVGGNIEDLAGNTTAVEYNLLVLCQNLGIDPLVAYNPVGTDHTVTASLGVPVEGVNVLFVVEGDNGTILPPVSTDSTGVATLTYPGTMPGVDTIKACLDLDGKGDCDGASELTSATATKYWLEKFVTGGGQVKTTKSVTVQVGKKLVSQQVTDKWFSFGGNVGIADDETQIVGNFQVNSHLTGEICHFKDFSSLVFSNSGKTATFVANGTCKKGGLDAPEPTGPVTFVVTDNGEPGVLDEITSTGYVSIALDTHVLTGGNFQVRPPVAGASMSYPATLEGKWLLSVNGGAFLHDMIVVTQNSDGSLSGTGGYPSSGPPYVYPYNWTMVGQLTGNTISMTITYENGYTATITGTVDTIYWDDMGGGAGTGGVTNWTATRVP